MITRGERSGSTSVLNAALVASAAGLALSLAGCSGNPSHETVRLVPNYSGFTDKFASIISQPNKCEETVPSSCGMAIFTSAVSPAGLDVVINARGEVSPAPWPRPDRRDHKGDPVTILCYDPHGNRVQQIVDKYASTDWYRVIVPKRYVINPEVRAALGTSESLVDSVRQAGQLGVAGWASILDFNERQPHSGVAECPASARGFS
jgi:hypothetical protein